MKIRIRFLRWSFLAAGYAPIAAQTGGSAAAVDAAAMEYLQTAGNQSVLYYGNMQEAHPSTTNHPYLEDNHYAKARLSYNHVVYPEVMLRLDFFRDELIILSQGSHNMILLPDYVDYVELHGRRVIYFHPDGKPGCPSREGYYIELYSGKCRVLMRQTATLMHIDDLKTYVAYYTMNKKFYLYRDGVYQPIRSQMGLLRAFRPYKRELKRFINANNLWFRKNPEDFLTKTVGEYERLSARP